MKNVNFIVSTIFMLFLAGCANSLHSANMPTAAITDVPLASAPVNSSSPPSQTTTANNMAASNYHVLGQVSVNRYNAMGDKLQDGIISDLLQQKASQLGGDGIINFQENSQVATATVIHYSNNLLPAADFPNNDITFAPLP